MERGKLETPAPFVFGGTFSDFKKEGRKFGRFSTLSSLAKAANDVGKADEPTRDEQIQQMYREAREQGIGTVDSIEVPEGSVNIVNLVEVARHIQATLMPGSIVEEEEEDEEEVDYDWEEEDEEEDEEVDIHAPAPCDLDCIGTCTPTLNAVGLTSKCDLNVATPIVYDGSFQDFKKEGAKFLRFSTLTSLSEAVKCNNQVCQADTSATESVDLSTQPSSEEIGQDGKTECFFTTRHSFIESVVPAGSVPCQLLALARPPCMHGESSLYVTLSDRIVAKSLQPTLEESQAAVKMTVAKASTKSAPEIANSICNRHVATGSVLESAMAADLHAAVTKTIPRRAVRGSSSADLNIAVTQTTPKRAHIKSKSPYRFRFVADDLGSITAMGHSTGKLPKVNIGGKSNDDGSSWIVDHSSIGARTRSNSFRHSGSSWGGGATQLDPICQDKLRLDSLAKVTVPPLPPRI